MEVARLPTAMLVQGAVEAKYQCFQLHKRLP
jgi:hypothetical protein